jgi:hypothetical protein
MRLKSFGTQIILSTRGNLYLSNSIRCMVWFTLDSDTFKIWHQRFGLVIYPQNQGKMKIWAGKMWVFRNACRSATYQTVRCQYDTCNKILHMWWMVNVKIQIWPYNRPRRPRESVTYAHDEGGWLKISPSWLQYLLKETRYPLYRRPGGPQVRSGRMLKISPSPGFDPRTVQPVAIRYIDWVIRSHAVVGCEMNADVRHTCSLSQICSRRHNSKIAWSTSQKHWTSRRCQSARVRQETAAERTN